MALERLKRFRELMGKYGIDAYIITDSDPHSSEYPADHWKARSWLSGFTGSNGVLAVTRDVAALWTDGRYYIQAEKQLAGSSISLMRIGEPGTPAYPDWIASKLAHSSKVGVDGRTFSCTEYNELNDSLAGIKAKVDITHDIIGEIWNEGRPTMPGGPIFLHELRYAGKPVADKLTEVRADLKKRGVEHTLVAGLEDVAWLFNIRSDDIRHLPVAYAYAFVSRDSAHLYIDINKVSGDVRRELEAQGIRIDDAALLRDRLKSLRPGESISCDARKLSKSLQSQIPDGVNIVYADEPTLLLKAIKNFAEVRGHRACQIHDGAAMVRFLMWVERELGGGADLREWDVVLELSRLRKLGEGSRGDSFNTIAGYGPHGAMMHYAPNPDVGAGAGVGTGECAGEGAGAGMGAGTDYGGSTNINRTGLMVVDCGGQYLGGTTDITRTIICGETTLEERRDYTLTLKSHIALAGARFLYGATGGHIDSIARKVMWDHGMDYKCGTGHGIGSYLSVHEGPQSISMRTSTSAGAGSGARLEENMFVSIEPGVYREGKHGVRIENLARIEEDCVNEFGRFMRFEILSFCPIDLRGIEVGMLDADECNWLNKYHRAVYEKISPLLNNDEREWLANATREI